MTVATRVAERTGRPPVQRLAALRMDEQLSAQGIADKVHALAVAREEITNAYEHNDRLTAVRIGHLSARILRDLENDTVLHVRMLHENTPAFVGERPLYPDPAA